MAVVIVVVLCFIVCMSLTHSFVRILSAQAMAVALVGSHFIVSACMNMCVIS